MSVGVSQKNQKNDYTPAATKSPLVAFVAFPHRGTTPVARRSLLRGLRCYVTTSAGWRIAAMMGELLTQGDCMREVVQSLEESRIREVANEGLGRSDVLKFWFGESDEVTPDFIRDAAIASLQKGETFYAHNLGLPELRHAIAGYMHGLHPQQHTDAWFDRIAVTSGGVNGLMVAITPGTRLLVVNAPNNPTGWTLTREEQATILAHCRRTGTWILADEVYERLYYAGDTANGAAPSFLDVAEPEDRLVVTHSFSKSFLMTGWRLGWLVLPPSLTHAVGKLIEFNTSCAPVFVQRGATVALQRTEEVTPALVAHLKSCRDTLVPLLAGVPR